MTNFRLRGIAGLVALVSVFVWMAPAIAGVPDKSNPKRTNSTYKVLGTPLYQILNINNIWTWMRSDGQSNHSPTNESGAFYPRGTRWAIYQDGIVWGGKAFLDSALTVPAPGQVIRVGGQTFNVGTQAGRITGFGATAQPVSTADPDVRIYRIRRDYRAMSPDELRRDAAESYEVLFNDVTQGQINDIIAQYELDWNEWPVGLGAPYIERNGTSGYQPPPPFSDSFTVDDLIAGQYDEPGLAGSDPDSPADQVVWTVYNDLNPALTNSLYGSEPLGLETQVTLWGYKRTDAMGQLYFKLVKIINKGGVDVGVGNGVFYIDSMYVAQWSDPDLGAFGDDLSGCDSVLSLGFVYNGNAIDAEFRKFNLPPPAVGYDFLQGPIVPSPGDSAVFNLQRRYDVKNLSLTSFAYFAAGSAISDPPFTREGGLRWWRMLQGYVPDPSTNPLRLYPHPPGMPETLFPLSGDPVRNQGFVDGVGAAYSFAPGDRRIVLNTGPFTMAPGDTQEIVVGTVGGLGSDRLSSIAVMKFNDRFVQNTYDALFQVPRSPTAPDVKVAELDGEIILEWGSNLARLADTEGRINSPGEYKFEGYNVYQLPSASAGISDSRTRRIATYDLETDPTVVLDEQFDPNSGQILQLPVQFGTNSGIKRYFRFNRDYIRDVDKIYNGQEYFLAVTAYSVANQEGFLPAALESELARIVARPRVPFGTTYGSSFGDTLAVTHVSGQSDGVITPIVIDPTRSTGATYEVRFFSDSTGDTWSLINTATGAVVLAGETNQTGDENYKLIDGGLIVKVAGPDPGLKVEDVFSSDDPSTWGWNWVEGARFLTWASSDGLGFEGFRGAAGWASPASVFGGADPPIPASALKAVEIRFAATSDNLGTFDPSDPNASYGYRYGRGFAGPPALPEFAPFIINAAGGYAYQDFTVSAPLAVYDIDADPPRRLAIGHLENNVAGGSVDGRYWPPFFSNADNVAGGGPREWLFIFDHDYSTTADPFLQREMIGSADLPVMYFITWGRRNDNPWPAGNILQLFPTRPNGVNDVFSFTAPPPVKGAASDRASAERVGVYPNPYYAFNPAETNRLVRFVTFNNLPQVATIRLFNLAGQLVRTLKKDDPSQFMRWDLNNEANFPVASGMYIAHIEMTLPSDGTTFTKTLKLAIIQEQEVLDVF